MKKSELDGGFELVSKPGTCEGRLLAGVKTVPGVNALASAQRQTLLRQRNPKDFIDLPVSPT
jgi:hypothetical protein